MFGAMVGVGTWMDVVEVLLTKAAMAPLQRVWSGAEDKDCKMDFKLGLIEDTRRLENARNGVNVEFVPV
jgi:hypothetical protein